MQERPVRTVRISRQTYHIGVLVFRCVFEADKVNILTIMLLIGAGPAVRARLSVNVEICTQISRLTETDASTTCCVPELGIRSSMRVPS